LSKQFIAFTRQIVISEKVFIWKKKLLKNLDKIFIQKNQIFIQKASCFDVHVAWVNPAKSKSLETKMTNTILPGQIGFPGYFSITVDQYGDRKMLKRYFDFISLLLGYKTMLLLFNFDINYDFDQRKIKVQAKIIL